MEKVKMKMMMKIMMVVMEIVVIFQVWRTVGKLHPHQVGTM
jgi:hypothetical protein